MDTGTITPLLKRLLVTESSQQQPCTPAYCTGLLLDELKSALASADKQGAPQNREALIKEFMAGNGKFTHDGIVAGNRAVTVMT